MKEEDEDLLVENAIVLIDIGDIAFVFVKPLAGKLALLVNTKQNVSTIDLKELKKLTLC